MDPTPPPTAPVPPPAAPQYEFTPAQNKVLADLADAMSWVALPLWVLAVLYMIVGLVNIAGAVVGLFYGPPRADALASGGVILLTAVLAWFLGMRMRIAADRFQAVVQTAGHDISHLMAGLHSLGRTFAVLRAMIQIYILFVLVMLVLAAVSWAVHWYRGEPTG